MDLQVPVPTIDIAVAMRNLSIYKTQRQSVNERDPVEIGTYKGQKEEFIVHLKNALYAALIITFAQGMSQLRSASQKYDYDLNLETVARIWRGGCIIRAQLLEKIRAAYAKQEDLPNLLLNSSLDEDVRSRSDDLRMVVSTATDLAIPTPALAVSLGYFYADHSAWLPANLIQAQRDYFGAHTYERIDEKGSFHTEWGHKE
jgi:6-phosphogluconate dehydrogenase